MYTSVLTVLAIALSLASFGETGPPKANDVKEIQGKWNIVSLTLEGQKREGDDIKDAWYKITATEITIMQGDRVVLPARKYTIDPSKKPKQIDIIDIIGINRKDGTKSE